MEVALRPCEVCGNPIPRTKKDHAARYEVKRYCSRSCQNVGARKKSFTDADGNLRCSKCRQFKPPSAFYPDSTTSRGFGYYCRGCMSILRPNYNKRDPRQERERHRQARLTHLEEYRARDRAYERKNRKQLNVYRRKHRIAFPNRQRARAAVTKAIKEGRLPHISTLQCFRCHQKAMNYHHPSYHRDDWLHVIPLCASCHMLLHKRPEVAEAVHQGIALTGVGMIRIAIASIDDIT